MVAVKIVKIFEKGVFKNKKFKLHPNPESSSTVVIVTEDK